MEERRSFVRAQSQVAGAKRKTFVGRYRKAVVKCGPAAAAENDTALRPRQFDGRRDRRDFVRRYSVRVIENGGKRAVFMLLERAKQMFARVFDESVGSRRFAQGERKSRLPEPCRRDQLDDACRGTAKRFEKPLGSR